jgi:hypothetical protein
MQLEIIDMDSRLAKYFSIFRKNKATVAISKFERVENLRRDSHVVLKGVCFFDFCNSRF